MAGGDDIYNEYATNKYTSISENISKDENMPDKFHGVTVEEIPNSRMISSKMTSKMISSKMTSKMSTTHPPVLPEKATGRATHVSVHAT
jgi:hypothetical protein